MSITDTIANLVKSVISGQSGPVVNGGTDRFPCVSGRLEDMVEKLPPGVKFKPKTGPGSER